MKHLHSPLGLLHFAIVMVGALIWHWQHVLALRTVYLHSCVCPLMHLFHGHGHSNHDHSHKHKDE